jgi:hypothetical protein
MLLLGIVAVGFVGVVVVSVAVAVVVAAAAGHTTPKYITHGKFTTSCDSCVAHVVVGIGILIVHVVAWHCYCRCWWWCCRSSGGRTRRRVKAIPGRFLDFCNVSLVRN